MMRRLLAKFIVVATVIAASVVVTGQAAAGPPRHGPPDLVVLGDSFAAGTGNTPYSDQACGRSKVAAYGERLEQLRLVNLQAFPACGGATTDQVIAQGQLRYITKDTDIVTVQAFGNDVGFSTLARICLGDDCSLNGTNRATVRAILDGISSQAQLKLGPFYAAIKAQISEVGSKARVIVVDYGNPLPAAGATIGPFCPYITPGEPEVAQQFADSINAELAAAAAAAGFTFANAAPRFRGLDICGLGTAFYRLGSPAVPWLPSVLPLGDPGLLHPNKLGQGIYAAVLAGRLYR